MQKISAENSENNHGSREKVKYSVDLVSEELGDVSKEFECECRRRFRRTEPRCCLFG